MSKPVPETAANTLGSRIDAVLAPFAADEERLQASISDLEAQVATLQAEIEGSRNDLSVVQSSKIESLREAAKADPLLSAAFAGLTEGPAASDDGTSDSANDSAEASSPGGHALLNM